MALEPARILGPGPTSPLRDVPDFSTAFTPQVHHDSGHHDGLHPLTGASIAGLFQARRASAANVCGRQGYLGHIGSATVAHPVGFGNTA